MTQLQLLIKTLKPKESFTDNHFYIIFRLRCFKSKSMTEKVKRSPIISNKYGTKEQPHELQNNLRLGNQEIRILGSQEISGKSENFIE